MNFEQIYNEWYASPVSHTVYEAFMAGVSAKESKDLRDVIIARQALELERKNTMIQELGEASHLAKESMLTALRELDKLRFGYF